jgi:branched-chain amino acid transport system permease protein
MTSAYIVLTGINILLAWSVYVIMLSGQVSIGNSAFMAIGAYVSGIMTVKFDMPLVLALVVSCLVSAIVGAGIGFPAIRLKGVYLIMVTIGIAASVETLFQNIPYVGGVGGFGGMYGTTVTLVLICVAIVGFILWWISKTPLQRVFEAIREDERVAASMGINVTYVKVFAFAIGAGIAALAGGLFSHYMTYISPENFGIWASIQMLLYVILGGTNNLWGPAFGAILMTLLPEYIRFLDEWRITVFGTLIVILLLFRPEGLLSFRSVTARIRNHHLSKSMKTAGEEDVRP